MEYESFGLLGKDSKLSLGVIGTEIIQKVQKWLRSLRRNAWKGGVSSNTSTTASQLSKLNLCLTPILSIHPLVQSLDIALMLQYEHR